MIGPLLSYLVGVQELSLNRKLWAQNVAHDLISENPERQLSVIFLRNIKITFFS